MKKETFNRTVSLVSIIVLTFVIVNCDESSDKAIRPIDLLPASGEISGWDKGTGPGDYGEADDQESLYDLINGAAELYIQYGFVEGVQQRYYGDIGDTPATVDLYIGDHGDKANVAAMFEEPELTPQNLTPWPEVGDEAWIDENALFHITIHLRADRFYVRVTVDKAEDENIALTTAQYFATAVVNDIE